MGTKIKKIFKKIQLKRTSVLLLVFILLSFVLIRQLYELQIIQGEDYIDEFQTRTTKTRVLKSTRGNIYDRNNKLIASNILSYSLTFEDNGSYDTTRQKNLTLNGTAYKVLQILAENGDSLSNTFHIKLDNSGNYVFDIDRFTSFEGNTGPYILYTIVRIKSILNRYKEEGGNLEAGEILPAVNASQKNLMLELTKFGSTIENAFEEKAPHKICAYIYEVSNAFNSFYHETKILSEENQAQKESFLKLLGLTKDILETSIDLLGFSAPDRM